MREAGGAPSLAECGSVGKWGRLIGGYCTCHRNSQAVKWRNFKGDPGAHDAESHDADRKEIPNRTLVLSIIH